MRIAIGCDQGGFVLKDEIIGYLNQKGYEIIDFGTNSEESVDYPDYGLAVATCVAQGKADFGILMCGTGVGISISANKVPGIRCALLSDCFSAKATREHNNANIVALGGRVIGSSLALMILEVFLNTSFSGDQRHIQRLNKISQIEKNFMSNES